MAWRCPRTCTAALALLVSAPTLAAGDQFWAAAADDSLENMRGGFSVAPGLMVSFGIVREVEINGAVVAATSMHLGDLRGMTAAQAEQLTRQLGVNVVQNGPGNAFNATVQGSVPALVVQNTLDGQKIRTVTQIDAVTNGMTMLKALNLSRTLSDAVGAAIRR